MDDLGAAASLQAGGGSARHHFVSKLLPRRLTTATEGIRAAIRWLREPTEEMAGHVAALAMAERWDGGVGTRDPGVPGPASVAGDTDVRRAARFAINTAPPAERQAALQWQVESAQAILKWKDRRP